MERNWNPETVDKYIKPESNQKTPEVFKKTHIPIDKIKAEILQPVDLQDDMVDQGTFRDAVLDSKIDDDNRIFIIRGEVGSGKSHLCQWLDYEINGYGDESGYDDTHVAIHISRGHTKLEEILQELHKHIDKEYDKVSEITDLNPEKVADFIIQGLNAFHSGKDSLSGFELEKFTEPHDEKTDLRDILIKNIQQYQRSVKSEEKEQRLQLLSEDDFGRICLMSFDDAQYGREYYSEIRQAINNLLIKNIGIGDFKKELKKISEQYKEEGKRPVLICEDLVAFNVLKDDLIDHIFDLSASNYDIVLGWTVGWEKENVDDFFSTSEDSLTYMKQRTQGYLSMTDENGQAYFLRDESAPVALVRQYLEAIKQESEVNVDVDEEAFDGIYPFNIPFIQYVYENLVQDGNKQQTPRVLLVQVISNCLKSDRPPYQSIKTNSYVKSRPSLVRIEKYSEECQDLSKWYGRKHSDNIWLNEELFDSFGVDSSSVDVDDSIAYLEIDQLSTGVQVELIEAEPGVSDPPKPPSTTDEHTPGDTKSEEDDEESETEEKVSDEKGDEDTGEDEKEVKSIDPEDLQEFQSWLKSGSEYPSDGIFREGIRNTINRFHDPTRLGNENATTDGTQAIYYSSGNDLPLQIQGIDESRRKGISIPHDLEHREVYGEMLYHGYYDTYDDDANFDLLRGWSENKVAEFRLEMREDIEEVLPEEMSIEEFLVLGNFILLNIARGETEVSDRLVFEEYRMRDTSPLSRNSVPPVNLPVGFEEAGKEIGGISKDIQELAKGFFLLKDNVVDRERLERAVDSVKSNRDEYLYSMADIEPNNLRAGYRVGTTRTNASVELKSILRKFSEYSEELSRMEEEIDLSDIESEISPLRSMYNVQHTESRLIEIFDNLEDYMSTLGVTKREEWDEAKEALEDEPSEIELGEFKDILDEFDNVEADSAVGIISLLHDYQRNKENNSAWQVYSTLVEIINELEGVEVEGDDDFRERLREEQEFTNVVEKCDDIRNEIEGV
jgi:hypothetical protein